MSLYIFVCFFIVYRILVQKYENKPYYRIWFTVFALYNRIKDVCFFLFSDTKMFKYITQYILCTYISYDAGKVENTFMDVL